MDNLKKILLGIFVFALLLFIPNVRAEETGTLGEYDTIEEAEEVASNTEVDNDEEKVETSITTEQREYIEKSVSFDETFSTNLGATVAQDAFRLTYRLLGYEEEDAAIETVIVTESSTEERTFNSIAEILAYRSLLQTAGYNVSIRIANLGLTTRETNKEDVDETFSSILDLFRYLLTLASDHNNFKVQFENNSYTITVDENVTKVFQSRNEAYAYLRSLNGEYQVSNGEVIYNDQPTQDVDHVQEYFESSTDAEDAYDNLQSDDYSLENKEIKLLSEDEIENAKDDIIEALALNNDEAIYRSISTPSNPIVLLNPNAISVIFEDENGDPISANGAPVVNEIIINGNSYTPILGNVIVDLPNNTVVKVRGTITTNHCIARRGLLCTSYKTIDFESYGLVNIERNNSLLPFDILTDNVFTYSITDYNDINKIISDNLIHVYSLDVDKVSTYYNPTYTVNAHIHKDELIRQYRVYGSVSKINLLPVYRLAVTRSKDVEKYHATATMVKKNTKNVYVVNYVRTLKETNNNEEDEVTPVVIPTDNNEEVTPAVVPTDNNEEVTPVVVPTDNNEQATPVVVPTSTDKEVTPTVVSTNSTLGVGSVENPKTYDGIIFYIICLVLSTMGLAVAYKKLNYDEN